MLGLRPAHHEPDDGTAHGDLGVERVVFLSDGLFAIALTLLVIDLRLPDLPASAGAVEISNAIADLAPRVFAYALSFTIIAFYWMAHLRRFKLIGRANAGLAYLNLLFLGFIALIPFPTALIGEHGDLPIAVVIYAGTLSAAGLAGFLCWVYALRADLVAPDAPRDAVRSGALRGLAAPVVMLSSLLLLPIASTYVVELVWLLILPVQWFLGRHAPPEGSRGTP
jgi:uncharacterized membrane protein